MKTIFALLLFLIINLIAPAQYKLGLSITAQNTTCRNFQAGYRSYIFNQLANDKLKEPFYGDLWDVEGTWTKSFNLWYRLAEKKIFNFYITAGTASWAHKELIDGGKSENYIWGLGRFPPGDTVFINNKITQYFLSLGPKAEYQVIKNIFAELQLSYNINFDNSDKDIRTFRSVFKTAAFSKHSGAKYGDQLPYADVTRKGFISFSAGMNANITSRFKIHLLYLRTVTKHTRYYSGPGSYHPYYQGIGIQLSYDFMHQGGSEDDEESENF